jgi:ATP-dependent protease ClpP protease subunit
MTEIQEIMLEQPTKKGIQPKTLGHLYEFYISGPIEGPEEYTEMFDKIRHATEMDVIKLYINSPGGSLSTAIQFLRVASESSAEIITSAEGECMSAATIMFLSGHSFEVTPHSMFMFHNYSGGAFGKGGEMIDQLQYERKWSERLLKDVYKNFLTEEEILSMLNNKDIWMDGEDVIERLKKRNELIEAEITQSQEEK